MLNKLLKRLIKGQKGITGLETAIILIAFVVVAAVFAYTVLSAGLFATQKSQEAVYSGLQETQATLELKGGVIAEGIGELDDCESAWTAGANFVTATDAAVKIEGSNSSKATSGDVIAAAQPIATKTLTASRNLSSNRTIYAWLRSSVAITGDATEYLCLTLVDATGNSSSASTVSGAITADTWKKVTWDISGLGSTSKDAVTAIRLDVAGTAVTIASGAVIYIDIVETDPVLSVSFPMKAYGDHCVFTVANAGGEPIDFTTTSDADADGIISDESTKTHKISINYIDAYQTVTDLAWTKTVVGHEALNNSMLESNEKYLITVDLSYINNNAASDSQKIGTDQTFTLEIKSTKGAVLVVERTMPNKITAINELN